MHSIQMNISTQQDMNPGAFLLSIAFLFQGIQVDAIEVEIWLHSYRNPDHKLANGSCCYSGCTQECKSRVIVRNCNNTNSMWLGSYRTGGDNVMFDTQLGRLHNPFKCTTTTTIDLCVRHEYMGRAVGLVAWFNPMVKKTIGYACCMSYRGWLNTNATMKLSYRIVQANQSSVVDLCNHTSNTCTTAGSTTVPATPAPKTNTSPALIGGISALAVFIIAVLGIVVLVIGLWKVFTKQKQRPESPTKPDTRPGPASWHNVMYTASDSPLGIPSGHTQLAPPLSASYHEYDLIDQGGATVHIKLTPGDRLKAPTSTEAAEEDYSSPADALTDGSFTAK